MIGTHGELQQTNQTIEDQKKRKYNNIRSLKTILEKKNKLHRLTISQNAVY